VVVATGLLQRGTRIQPEQVELADREARLVNGVVIERVEDVLHAEVVRDIPAGTVLRGSDIRPAWLVRKGQLVQLTWSPSPGFQITARVESLENGRMGEPVRLKNRDSGRIISGVVTGLGTAAGL
jgi:flagella basal body P-ring formation protein FlgA